MQSSFALPSLLVNDKEQDPLYSWPDMYSHGLGLLPETPAEQYSPLSVMSTPYAGPYSAGSSFDMPVSLMDLVLNNNSPLMHSPLLSPQTPISTAEITKIIPYTPLIRKKQKREPSETCSEGGANRVVCTDCGSSFRRKADLRRHQMCVHFDLRSFVCPHNCGASFSRRDALKRHLDKANNDKLCAGYRKPKNSDIL